MNSLTLLMLLPIIGSIAVAATPKAKEVLTKQVALATTVIVAGATIAMAMNFQRDNVDLQFVEKYSCCLLYTSPSPRD